MEDDRIGVRGKGGEQIQSLMMKLLALGMQPLFF